MTIMSECNKKALTRGPPSLSDREFASNFFLNDWICHLEHYRQLLHKALDISCKMHSNALKTNRNINMLQAYLANLRDQSHCRY